MIFFSPLPSSIQPENALTYQAGIRRALCPNITDFLLRTNEKTRSFVSALAGPTNLFSDCWMQAGTPVLLGYCISPLPETHWLLVKQRQLNTVESWEANRKRSSIDQE